MNRRPFAEIVRRIDDRVITKGMRLLLRAGLAPTAFALLETTGRRTRGPRQTPVGNGQVGDTFWLVAARGEAAHYVRNLRHDPAVRVKIGRTWSTGTADVLPDDDPDRRLAYILAHHGRLRRLDARALESSIRLLGTTPVVVRIRLEPAPASATVGGRRSRNLRVVRLCSPGWWLQVVGIAHAGFGSVLYRAALAEIARDKVVGSVPDRGDKATAFWFIAVAPALWLGGRLLRSAESAGDLDAQRAAGTILTATGVAGVAAMPASGFWAVVAVGLGALRRSLRPRALR